MRRSVSTRYACLSLATLAGLLLTSACNQSPAQNSAPATSATSAVKLDIKSYDEVQSIIKSHVGKVVVMDAWSTSCEPCLKEFPGLVALHKKYGPDKLTCISLSCDYSGIGKPEQIVSPVLEFLQKQGATFQNILSKDDDSTLFTKLGIASIPAVFVYGKDGQLVKKIDGDFHYKDLEPLIADLLK